MLKKCKTLETFFVFKVSHRSFAPYYERKNFTSRRRYVLELRV